MRPSSKGGRHTPEPQALQVDFAAATVGALQESGFSVAQLQPNSQTLSPEVRSPKRESWPACSRQHRIDLFTPTGNIRPVEEVVTQGGSQVIGQLVADFDGELGYETETILVESAAVRRLGEDSTGRR